MKNLKNSLRYSLYLVLVVFVFCGLDAQAQTVDTCRLFMELREAYEEYLCDDSTYTIEFRVENYEIAKLKLEIKYIEGYKHYTDTIMLRESVGWYPPHYIAYYYTEKCKEYKYTDFISWVSKKYCH